MQASEVAELLDTSRGRREQQPAAGPRAPGQARPGGRARRARARRRPQAGAAGRVRRRLRALRRPAHRAAAERRRRLGDAAVHRLVRRGGGDRRPSSRPTARPSGPATRSWWRCRRTAARPGRSTCATAADGVHRAFQLQVPTVGADGVTHVAAFFDTDLFARFGLPDELPRRAPRARPGAAQDEGDEAIARVAWRRVRAADLLAVPQHAGRPGQRLRARAAERAAQHRVRRRRARRRRLPGPARRALRRQHPRAAGPGRRRAAAGGHVRQPRHGRAERRHARASCPRPATRAGSRSA